MRAWIWAVSYAAAISGVFAFGIIASPFAALAQGLFFVFAAALVALGTIALFTHEHGGALVDGSRKVVLLALAGSFIFVVYGWIDNRMTAEKLGRDIDRRAAALGDHARTAAGRAGDYLHRVSDRRGDPEEEETAQR